MSDDLTRPDRYALAVAFGPPGRRAVLFALAIRAHVECGCVIGGDWLARAAGESAGSVRRHVHAMADVGVFAVNHCDGGPLVVRFPTPDFDHNTAQQCADHPAHWCAGCYEWGRAMVQRTPRNGAADPAQQCAGKHLENIYKTGAPDPSNEPGLSTVDARRVWMSARDEARAELR